MKIEDLRIHGKVGKSVMYSDGKGSITKALISAEVIGLTEQYATIRYTDMGKEVMQVIPPYMLEEVPHESQGEAFGEQEEREDMIEELMQLIPYANPTYIANHRLVGYGDRDGYHWSAEAMRDISLDGLREIFKAVKAGISIRKGMRQPAEDFKKDSENGGTVLPDLETE